MTTNAQIATWLTRVEGKIDGIAAAIKPPAPPPPPAPEPSPAPLPTPPAPPVVTVPPTPGIVPWMRSRPFVMPAIKRAPADLIAARLVPPYDKKFIRGPQPEQTSNQPGVWPGFRDMGGTGERKDIGLVNEDASIWLTGQSSPSDMIIWGETHSQVPVHFRVNDQGQADPAGAFMVDVIKQPKASCFWRKEAVGADPHFPITYDLTKYINPEMAHYPSAAYVPFLATQDLYYLQEVQDAATFMIINGPPNGGIMRDDQTRGYAWGLNMLAQAYLATLEAEKSGPLPAPLLPSTYWKQVIDRNRDEFAARWVGKAPCRFAVQFGGSPWMQDMLGAVLGWMVWTGKFPDWRANYDWHIQQAIDRTSGQSGYPRSKALQYGYAQQAATLPELAKVNGLTENPGDPLYIDSNLLSYGAYLRGNLKFAVLNGVPGAVECLAYVDAGVSWIPPKWCY